MKLWSHICFLVLATSSGSRGQTTLNVTLPGSHFPPKTNGSELNDTVSTSQSPSLDNGTVSTAPNNLTKSFSPEYDEDPRREGGNSTVTYTSPTAGVTNGSRWSSVAAVTTDVSKATSASTSAATIASLDGSEDYSSGGYVMLVLIIVLIVGLCVVLYMLRRNSRTYSFDLQRPLPVNYANEPTGTFEPVHLDDLEPPAQLDDVATDDLSPPSVGNGTTAQSGESSPNGLISPVEPQDANGLGTCPISPPVSEQSAEQPLDSATLLSSGALQEPQNENNNHPSVCFSDLFVDININEPAWSDPTFE